MGLFDKLFKNNNKDNQVNGYFKMLNGYAPVFSTYDGGVYEMELTRSCIHTFANHCSKLSAKIEGADIKGIAKILNGKPNQFMNSAQFIYKVATIYETQNTCFIAPMLDRFDRIVGFYPLNPKQVEIVTVKGSEEPYIRYTFANGEKAAIELSKVGIVSKFLYNSDIYGESNRCLNPTMNLISIQNQGIQQGIKNGASFRFMANVNNFVKAEDLAKERKRFVEENLQGDSGGLALFPNTYTNIQQIKSEPLLVDAEQMKIIDNRVYNYFGSNEDILQNKAVGDSWSAYYEGKVEPFAIQLSEALTNMCFTEIEQSRANKVVFASNRMQYMTNTEKLNVAQTMFDRGIFSRNDIYEMWNMPKVDGGDTYYIRKEYIDVSKLDDNEIEVEDDTEREEQV